MFTFKWPNFGEAHIPISLDKQTASWRRTMIRMNTPRNNSYLLLNASKTSFSKQYNFNEIPSYLLFSKEGKIINDNAPAPGEAALSMFLDKLILE